MPSIQTRSVASWLAIRERRRRRGVLIAMAVVFVLTASPVFGHHLDDGAVTLLAGTDHVWFLCLAALQTLLTPVHYAFHILFITGLCYAVCNRVRAWRRTRKSLALLDARVPSPGDAFWGPALAAGIAPKRLRIVGEMPVPAFTAGWLRPHIYVSRRLAGLLTADELDAVLMHEGAHARRRDPLTLAALRWVSLLVWWIPALRHLADDAADEAEICADDAAARGQPLVLASAILSLAEWRRASVPPPAMTVGFEQADLLDRRIRRLAGEAPPIRTHLTRRSAFGAGAVLAVLWLSGLMMAHPLPAAMGAMPNADHCAHHHELALWHLFCPGFGLGRLAGHCPHAVAARPLPGAVVRTGHA